jgi:hypothetical protein
MSIIMVTNMFNVHYYERYVNLGGTGRRLSFTRESTGNRRNSGLDGRRQPSLGGTSRMNREIHVRICEGLEVIVSRRRVIVMLYER